MVYERFVQLLKEGHFAELEQARVIFREELREGVYATINDWLANVVRPKTKWVLKDPIAATYVADGEEIVVSDWSPEPLQGTRLLRLTRDGKVKWVKTYPTTVDPMSLDYNPFRNTILGYWGLDMGLPTERGAVIEWDAETGEKLRTLESTELGPISPSGGYEGMRICVDPYLIEEDKFWIADYENHVVLLIDFEGKVHWQFGTYGTPGSGTVGLRNPMSVSAFRWSKDQWCYALIGDAGNDRVLLVREDKAWFHEIPFPSPQAFHFGNSALAAVFSGAPWTAMLGVFILSHGLQPYPLPFHVPYPTNFVVSHPGIFGRCLLGWSAIIWEHQFRFDIAPTAPVSCPLWKEQSALAGTPVYSRPIVDWHRPRKLIAIKPTQAGTVKIEIPRFVESEGTWDTGWETYLTESLTANKLTPIPIPHPLGPFRMVVTLDVDGKIDGWVNLSP